MSSQSPPLVSFYMSVKNGLPFLIKSIDSIKKQSYPNWEAVIVDDGSSDESLRYLRKVESLDPRFTVIATEGVGRGKALNMAIEHARGRYVANLDADDVSHPQRLEIQMLILTAKECRFLFSKTSFVYDDADAVWPFLSHPVIDHVEDVSMELMKRNPVSHVSVMCRRSDILAVGGYSESRKTQLDYELWFRLVKYGVRLQRTGYPLVAKRIHARQSFENKRRMIYLLSSVLLQNNIITEMKGGARYRAYPILRFCYGLLPQKFRVRHRQ